MALRELSLGQSGSNSLALTAPSNSVALIAASNSVALRTDLAPDFTDNEVLHVDDTSLTIDSTTPQRGVPSGLYSHFVAIKAQQDANAAARGLL